MILDSNSFFIGSFIGAVATALAIYSHELYISKKRFRSKIQELKAEFNKVTK